MLVMSILGKSVLIVAFAAGLLTQFFPCCAFAIRSFSKVSATPDRHIQTGRQVCLRYEKTHFLALYPVSNSHSQNTLPEEQTRLRQRSISKDSILLT